MHKVIYVGMVVVFLATMFLAVQWFTTSIVITQHGYVRWADGWKEVEEYWLGSS